MTALSKFPLKGHSMEVDDDEVEEVIQWLQVCGFKESFDGLVQMYIVQIKANMLPIPYSPVPNAKLGSVIYKGPIGRIFHHSCTPNVDLLFDPISMEGHFKTLRPVKKGEELRLNYLLEDDIYEPVEFRRMKLAQLGTSCDCLRCSDSATEGGTYSTAFKCNRGPDHWLLPRLGKTITADSRFYCNKCKASKTVLEINRVLGVMNDEFQTSKHDYESVKASILKYSGSTVHPNHLLLHARWIKLGTFAFNAITIQYQIPPSEFAFDLHRKYLSDLDRILELMAILHPGRVLITGRTLFVHSILLMSALAEEVTNTDPPPLGDYDDRLGKIMEEAHEGWIILTEDPLITSNFITTYKALRTVYANHLLAALEARFEKDEEAGGSPQEKPSKYMEFKDQFANADLNFVEIIQAQRFQRSFTMPEDPSAGVGHLSN